MSESTAATVFVSDRQKINKQPPGRTLYTK